MFPNRNIQRFTWTSPDGKTHNQIDHVLIDIEHSGQQIVILTTVWWWQILGERLAVSKETMHRVHMQRFNLKKLNGVEGKQQYRAEVPNRFAALENLRH
jgi:hypothetical protein